MQKVRPKGSPTFFPFRFSLSLSLSLQPAPLRVSSTAFPNVQYSPRYRRVYIRTLLQTFNNTPCTNTHARTHVRIKRYGTELCYTPMMYSGKFATDAEYRATAFTTCKEDR